MTDQKDWVAIAETIHAPQAVSWRDFLIDAGITVVLDPPVTTADPYPTISSAMIYEIFVQGDDAERAREVLESMATEVDSSDEDEDE